MKRECISSILKLESGSTESLAAHFRSQNWRGGCPPALSCSQDGSPCRPTGTNHSCSMRSATLKAQVCSFSLLKSFHLSTHKMVLLSLAPSSWKDAKMTVLLAAQGLPKPCIFGRGKWRRRWTCKGEKEPSSELKITAQVWLRFQTPALLITLKNL